MTDTDRTKLLHRWMESNGVVVMRPVEAWSDPRHFLHRTISLVVDDQTVVGALAAVRTALGPLAPER